MPALRASRPFPILVLGVIAALPLLSCSSGGVSEPVQDAVGDTYVMATITMRDTGNPCNQFGCDPEMYECRSRQQILVGRQWELRGDVASAGTLFANPGTNFAITATDVTTKVGIALEFSMTDFSTGGFAAVFSSSTDGTYVDVDVECDHLTALGPESRFDYFSSGVVNLTAASVNAIGTAIVPAVSDGAGGFSPPGIFEGTFSFIGRTFQPIPGDTLEGLVQVNGCFRVNLPAPERGVPVTPTPTSPSPACP